MRAKSAASAQRRASKSRVSRNESTETLMRNHRARKGKCPQKVGMWGTLSTDYRTPSNSTHDARYSQTISNQN